MSSPRPVRRDRRRDRDRGSVGVGSARNVARVPQPAQPGCADRRRQSGFLRQHLARGQRTISPMCSPAARNAAWPSASKAALERTVHRLSGATDAVVAFDCRVIEIKSVGTHNVVFAGVVGVRLGRRGRACLSRARLQTGLAGRSAHDKATARLRSGFASHGPGEFLANQAAEQDPQQNPNKHGQEPEQRPRPGEQLVVSKTVSSAESSPPEGRRSR